MKHLLGFLVLLAGYLPAQQIPGTNLDLMGTRVVGTINLMGKTCAILENPFLSFSDPQFRPGTLDVQLDVVAMVGYFPTNPYAGRYTPHGWGPYIEEFNGSTLPWGIVSGGSGWIFCGPRTFPIGYDSYHRGWGVNPAYYNTMLSDPLFGTGLYVPQDATIWWAVALR